MKRFSAWANRNPLLAVWLGFFALLVIMCAASATGAFLVRHADAPAHVRGAT